MPLQKNISPNYVIDCVGMTPFERLKMLSSESDDISEITELIEKEYEWFLSLREEKSEWWAKNTNKVDAMKHADVFHNLVVRRLMNAISMINPELHSKTDNY